MADISVAPASANFSHGIQTFSVFLPCPSLGNMDLNSANPRTDALNDSKLDRLLGNDEASCSTTLKADATVDFSLTDVSRKLKGISVSDGRKGVLRGNLRSSSAKKVSFAENLTPFTANLKRSVTIGAVSIQTLIPEDIGSLGVAQNDENPDSRRRSSTDTESGAETAGVAPEASLGGRNFDDVWASLQSCDGGSSPEDDAEDDEKTDDDAYGKSTNLSRAASDMLWQLRRFEVLGASHGTPKAADGQENKLLKKVSF